MSFQATGTSLALGETCQLRFPPAPPPNPSFLPLGALSRVPLAGIAKMLSKLKCSEAAAVLSTFSQYSWKWEILSVSDKCGSLV